MHGKETHVYTALLYVEDAQNGWQAAAEALSIACVKVASHSKQAKHTSIKC